MASELVAGALLTAMFDKLFERLASPELRNSTTAYKLKRLESKLITARLYLDDAENRQMRDKSIKEWLDNLKHLVFQVDDLSEEFLDNNNPNSGSKFLMEFLKSFFQCLAGTVQGELDEILMELDALLNRVNALGLKHCDGTARDGGFSSTANPAPLLKEHHVFGRKEDKEEILELLLSDKAFGAQRTVGAETRELSQKKIGVVPIVGMGGIGKTTLAHLVYNDTRVKPEFQLRAWVTVSTDFDIVKILKSILEQISPGAVGTETGELYQLQQKMKDALSSKKFFIVLDDVWDECYSNWNLLKSNFEWGELGSKVVVTTRSGKVGDMVKTGPIHRLREVSSEDCWSIFIDHAFRGGNSDSFPRLHEIGRKIVEKCDGLPLAVMAMGGLLCSTRDPREWENVLNNPIWDIGENNQGHGVLPSLWLSYRYLPSSLKQCFAYCSVFSQDFEFDKKQMALLWMAEGFLPADEKEKQSVEETGEKYFNILVSRSLFQRSSKDESMFVMHDLIHDLAAFVSGKFCVSVTMKDVGLQCVTIRTRHLSYILVSLTSNILSGVSKAKHLRSFLTSWDFGNDEFAKKLITSHRRLRVLSISIANPSSVSFCNLKHLRYLNLLGWEIKEVPSSVCTLFNLQTLILSGCYKLTQLPRDITKLMKLRHLDITETGMTHMPPQMGKLKELRTLSRFIVGDPDVISACSNIKEMQELQHLSGTLTIFGLENAAKCQDVGKDILIHMANLKELVLNWDFSKSTEISKREDKAVLDALQPHANLEKLVIERYESALSFPVWVGDVSFEKLVSVKLLAGEFCNSLPPLGQLPSLLKLVIINFQKLEKIGLEFYGKDCSTTPFRRLETLELHWMQSLEEWVFVDKAFPCLKNLTLNFCSNLPVSSIDCKTIEVFDISGHFMECFPLDKFPKLRKLSLEYCRNLKAVTNDGNSESFTSLKLDSCQNMESLGLPKSLTHLQISHYDSELISQQTPLLDLQNLVSSSELFANVLLPNSLASLELHYLGGFKSLNGGAFQQAKSLKTLDIYECNALESLPEKELPSSLSTLKISYCDLLERKYHKRKGDGSYQRISHIPHLTIEGSTTNYINDEIEEAEGNIHVPAT